MAEYGQTAARIRRERETEQRVRAMDAVDIVEEIHTLEDRIGVLEDALEEARSAASVEGDSK